MIVSGRLYPTSPRLILVIAHFPKFPQEAELDMRIQNQGKEDPSGVPFSYGHPEFFLPPHGGGPTYLAPRLCGAIAGNLLPQNRQPKQTPEIRDPSHHSPQPRLCRAVAELEGLGQQDVSAQGPCLPRGRQCARLIVTAEGHHSLIPRKIHSLQNQLSYK